MVRLLALVISFGLQIVAASIALRIMKISKYRLSWIFLSLAFTLMAGRKVIQLIEVTRGVSSEEMAVIDEWMGTLISVLIISGVIFIREIFISLKRAETERTRSERRVLHAIITTEENERKRFAKDLHDGLGPLLSTVKMSVSALSSRITKKADKDILNNTSYVVNEALATIKDISNILSPHVLSNFGLASAAGSFISKVSQAGGLKISFKTNIEDDRFNRVVEVVMYRAICELVNNSIKHSGASNVEIELNKHGKFLILQFSDNGKGFDTSLINSNENMGMGISNIETRVKSVNGVFTLDSSPGKGLQSLIRINYMVQEPIDPDYE